MKNYIFRNLFIVSSLILALATSCLKEEEGEETDFELTVPESWEYQFYSDPEFKYWAWSPQRLLDDEAGINDSINEDIYVSKQSLANASLADFYTALIDILLDDPSFYELSAVDTTINGVEAKKVTHLQTVRIPIRSTYEPADSADLLIQPVKYLFYRNGYGYMVNCNTLPYTYDYYKPVFEDIMSTFNFRN